MQIDARSFKAGYAPAFLSRDHADKVATKRQIAKAYFAGTKPKELAEEYGISVPKVIGIAHWYDREKMQARKLARAAATPKRVIVEPTVDPIAAPSAATTYTVEKRFNLANGGSLDTIVTLPLLSIQRAKERA